MYNKSYKARRGDYLIRSDDEAQEVGKYLEKQFPSGSITAEAVLQVAKKRDSLLHKYFEWDDKKAANQYRLKQARGLIRAIVIVQDNGQEIPAYHNVRLEADNSYSYMGLDQCLNTPQLWNQVLQTAVNEATYWAERYKSYKELEPIRSAILAVSKEISSAAVTD